MDFVVPFGFELGLVRRFCSFYCHTVAIASDFVAVDIDPDFVGSDSCCNLL